MQWSAEQERAIDAVGQWLAAREWLTDRARLVFYLAGYAGTGKTTLARHLAESWGNVAFAAYTGKAAHVLRSKGCREATTIHSLVYITCDEGKAAIRELEEQLEGLEETAYLEYQEDKIDHPNETEWKPSVGYARARQAVVECKAKIEKLKKGQKGKGGPSFMVNPMSRLNELDGLVVDECSMVDQRMGEDILSFGKPILVLGDPAQLPPVRNAGYFTERKPDFVLQEVHRQAKDSAILWLATRVRQGRSLDQGEHGEDLLVFRKADAARYDMQSIVTSADQLLVGKNATRTASNRRFRSLQNRTSAYPQPGERLVCLQNNHDLGLLNGSSWAVGKCVAYPDRHRVVLTVDALEEGLHVRDLTVQAHSAFFEGEEPDWFEKRDAECFDYAYAQTVHKAQGSQWDSVVLQDESYCFKRGPDGERNARSWLYTGITRAAKKLVVIAP